MSFFPEYVRYSSSLCLGFKNHKVRNNLLFNMLLFFCFMLFRTHFLKFVFHFTHLILKYNVPNKTQHNTTKQNKYKLSNIHKFDQT